MTTVEEELLLNEPTGNDYENLAVIDEDLLLGAGDARKATLESTDSFLLDSVEPPSEQAPEQVPGLENVEENGEIESEKEELDYDEEEDDNEDRRERTSRYTSEKNTRSGRQDSDESGGDNKKENGDAKSNRTGIPSLFDKTITNNPMKSGDKPIGVVLRIEGEPEKVFYPHPAFMMQLHQQHPIVPRLPNGIPLVGMPSNHGRAGFGVGYQQKQQQQNQQGRLVGGGGMPGQWDNEVEKFLSSAHSTRHSKKRRSRSYSTTSSYSSDSRSRSRESSRSDKRRDEKRRRRGDDRRDERRRDDRDNRRRDDRDSRRRHGDRRSRDGDTHRRDSDKRRKEQSKQSAMESVRALGLSNDYMEQVNEQKRRRDEILKRKEERRHGHSYTDKISYEKGRTVENNTPLTSTLSSEKDSKITKAYLAVRVSGVKQLPTAVKKIEALAVDLGPIKKCWRSADNDVSVIFNAHDKAKDFMMKYNGKVLSGLKVDVLLEKKFLNLSEIN